MRWAGAQKDVKQRGTSTTGDVTVMPPKAGVWVEKGRRMWEGRRGKNTPKEEVELRRGKEEFGGMCAGGLPRKGRESHLRSPADCRLLSAIAIGIGIGTDSQGPEVWNGSWRGVAWVVGDLPVMSTRPFDSRAGQATLLPLPLPPFPSLPVPPTTQRRPACGLPAFASAYLRNREHAGDASRAASQTSCLVNQRVT
jgi:hypothetical protein